MLLALAILPAMAGPADAQFGKNKVRYDDFEWKIYHSTHFDVYYYAEEADLLQKIVSFAESAYDDLSQKFDFQIQETTPLIFYETHNAFEQTNVILNFIPEGLGAFATPTRNRMVLPVDLPDPELMALIRHELTHIFQYHILFGGNLGKGITATPPLWFMEGMASYMAEDETARDKMYLRDAVVNDRLPPVTADFSGFFAYRFGHAVFDYIEETYGREAIRDFMVEIRNTLGGRVGRAIERTFGETAEDFNGDFRRWLRKKYLPELLDTGEPADFGRPFRLAPGKRGAQTSPAASPSGDLLAAFNTEQGQVDVMLFDTRKRTVLSNLTKGYNTSDFQYLVAQELTLGRSSGRDLDFSPDGNQVAFFARRQGGRALVVIDVLKAKVSKIYDMDVDQQLSPAFSPDGTKVAFSGYRGSSFDIFLLDLETGQVTNFTEDDIFDSAPTFSPDGESMVVASVVGGYSKLFRIELDAPGERFPVTQGQTNETDPIFSADGKRLYFTSDRTGANNIFGLDIESGELNQHTNSITGAFQPTVLPAVDGKERLVYTAFWKGEFALYLLDVDDPITEPTVVAEAAAPADQSVAIADLARYEPAIEVAIDDANEERYGGFSFFVEDVGGTIGVSDDQTFIGATYIQLSDFLGDRRVIGAFQSIESFQNFDVIYTDLSRRWQWQAYLFDNRDFFIARDGSTGFLERGRAAVSQTGLLASVIYPINFSHRFELGAGYVFRDLDYQSFAFDENGIPILDDNGFLIPIVQPRSDDYPLIQGALVGDTAVYEAWGPVTGRRWRLSASWSPDSGSSTTTTTGGSSGSTLTSNVSLELRQYLPVSRRTNFAMRLFGSSSDGNFPTPIYFGGLDSVRGYEFRSLVGTQAFFANVEYRFPLVDLLLTPVLNFQGVRGVVFFDVAGAWFDDVQSFRFYDSNASRLQDAVASYGWGFSMRFLGLNWNFDFAKTYDLETSANSFETSWWIGQRF